MARVKPEVQAMVTDMVNEIPDEHVATCGLCNRTLFDNLISIAVQSGAPEKTVSTEFAKRYNEGKREEDQITGDAFYKRIQYIHKVNERELKTQSGTINLSPIGKQTDTQEPNVESADLKSQSGTISNPFCEPGLKGQSDDSGNIESYKESKDPYEAIIDQWREQDYSAEDVYEVFLTELLHKFSPEAVKYYRRDAGVQLGELGLIIGRTVFTDKEIEPEVLHHEIRSGLEKYGNWSETKVDRALGQAPLLPEQIAAGDF